uniref:WW domain binding protein VOPP1 n=1 Tax=Lates calcarifer TaxID=8187 RepID=A0A4W6ENA8_LATCA
MDLALSRGSRRNTECVEAKKYCWYFEGGYPIYFICRSYEDCCGTRCFTVWAVVLLMMGVLFCCGAGFFIRRRMYPSPLRDEPAFNRTVGFKQIHRHKKMENTNESASSFTPPVCYDQFWNIFQLNHFRKKSLCV